MPVSVRQIPPNRRSVTGKWPSNKTGQTHGFESTLERDLMVILEFDPFVENFCGQPVRVDYINEQGKPAWTIPDTLVFYRRDLKPVIKPVLYEVKYAADVFKKWKELHPKLRAASRYARLRGWEFRLITEREIRTPYLDNAKFLLPYLRCAEDPDEAKFLMDRIREFGEVDMETLLASLFNSEIRRAQICGSLYKLIADFRVGIDLDEPLTLKSLLWSTR